MFHLALRLVRKGRCSPLLSPLMWWAEKVIRVEIVAEVLPRNELVAFEVFAQNCEDESAWSCAPRHFLHFIRAD